MRGRHVLLVDDLSRGHHLERPLEDQEMRRALEEAKIRAEVRKGKPKKEALKKTGMGIGYSTYILAHIIYILFEVGLQIHVFSLAS